MLQNLIRSMLLGLLVGCFSCTDKIELSGNVLKETYPVSYFKGVRLQDGLQLHIEPGRQNNIIIEADKELISLVNHQIKDSILYLSINESHSIPNNTKIAVSIFKDSLASIVATNFCRVDIKDTLYAHLLDITMSTNSSIQALKLICAKLNAGIFQQSQAILTGKIGQLKANIISQSKLDAPKLLADTINIKLNYASSANIHAVYQLNIDLRNASSSVCGGAPYNVVSIIDRHSQFQMLPSSNPIITIQ